MKAASPVVDLLTKKWITLLFVLSRVVDTIAISVSKLELLPHAELPPGTSSLTYSIGFVVATGLLHACGIGIGTIHRWSYGRLALRALGGLISVVGIMFLSQAFA